MNNSKGVQLIWLKRDLRLTDHAPIFHAAKSGKPILLWYCFEPILYNDPHYSPRHFRFIEQSLADLQETLINFNTKILITEGNPLTVLQKIRKEILVQRLLAHEETGVNVTFQRDVAVTKYCNETKLTFLEYQYNGVIRGTRNRVGWKKKWDEYVAETYLDTPLELVNWMDEKAVDKLSNALGNSTTKTWVDSNKFQRGGPTTALRYLQSFLNDRIKDYARGISKPGLSRKTCSRLSPYIAWGNISIRQAFQTGILARENSHRKKQFNAFLTRLQWHCHFIQKFEMECSMEFGPYNSAYLNLSKELDQTKVNAWLTGKTGYPLVDACMRCLQETGYMNFRMRAMVVSFVTHNLWQPWTAICHELAKMFLDFEPGIHYPQIQMQAGETGTNTLRIYNPVKQSIDQDPEGEFIKKWVPELIPLTTIHIHEPWKMTSLDQQFSGVILGETYPKPIVDYQETSRKARDVLWKFRKRDDVRIEAIRVVDKLVIRSNENKRKKNR